MQRRRSVPHTFEENIAAERAKLEAQNGKAEAWSRDGRASQEDQAIGHRVSYKRLAFVAGTAAFQTLGS